MAQKLYEESNIQAIANKIREKALVETTYKTSEMPSGINTVYDKGYSNGYSVGYSEGSSQSGEGGITPIGTIDITENGTYDVTNYASANVNVASSGSSSSNIVTGEIEILNPSNATSNNYQITTTDWKVSFDIGKHDIKNIAVVYCDEEKEKYANNRCLFIGNQTLNGIYTTYNNTGGNSENVSFLDESATFCRYDKTLGIIYLHANQWNTIKCGKYRYFAW